MAERKRDVTMSIPPALLRKLDRLAKIQGVSRSALVVELLHGAVAEADDLVKVMANDRVRNAMLGALAKPGVVRAIAQALGHELEPADGQKVLQFFKAAGMVGGKGNV